MMNSKVSRICKVCNSQMWSVDKQGAPLCDACDQRNYERIDKIGGSVLGVLVLPCLVIAAFALRWVVHFLIY